MLTDNIVLRVFSSFKLNTSGRHFENRRGRRPWGRGWPIDLLTKYDLVFTQPFSASSF